MSNLGVEILVELKRNRELAQIYRELPNGAGIVGAMLIENDIVQAEKALADSDVIEILVAYKKLKGNE